VALEWPSAVVRGLSRIAPINTVIERCGRPACITWLIQGYTARWWWSPRTIPSCGPARTSRTTAATRKAACAHVLAVDSHDAYDYTLARHRSHDPLRFPCCLRKTNPVCHAKSVVVPAAIPHPLPHPDSSATSIAALNEPCIRPPRARGLREKLAAIAEGTKHRTPGRNRPATPYRHYTSGISYMHVREAAPEASGTQDP
jgi:hypothetical protein